MTRKDKTSSVEEDINQNLKRIFDEVANEDQPPRLLKQLEELWARDARASDRKDNVDEE